MNQVFAPPSRHALKYEVDVFEHEIDFLLRYVLPLARKHDWTRDQTKEAEQLIDFIEECLQVASPFSLTMARDFHAQLSPLIQELRPLIPPPPPVWDSHARLVRVGRAVTEGGRKGPHGNPEMKAKARQEAGQRWRDDPSMGPGAVARVILGQWRQEGRTHRLKRRTIENWIRDLRPGYQKKSDSS